MRPGDTFGGIKHWAQSSLVTSDSNMPPAGYDAWLASRESVHRLPRPHCVFSSDHSTIILFLVSGGTEPASS